MSHPRIVVTIDGQPMSTALVERLVSVTVTDNAGDKSDTIDLEFEWGPTLAIPRRKAIITATFAMAGAGLADFGRFEADEPELTCIPYKLNVQGKSADMRASLKEQRERHWDGADFGTVARQVLSEGGLGVEIDPSIASFKGREGYFLQEGESNLHFVRRVAKRIGGELAIKNGKAIIYDAGSGKRPDGQGMSVLMITPPMVQPDSTKVKFVSRDPHKKVRAGYHDSEEATRKYEEVESGHPYAETDFTLRHNYANKDEAKKAAGAKAKELSRSADSFSTTIEGNAAARGGAEVTLVGFHPEADGTPFVIETATHKFDKGSGWTVDISAKGKGSGGS
jgi:phage protein D